MSTEHIPVSEATADLLVPVQRIQGAPQIPVLVGKWQATGTPEGVTAKINFGIDGRASGRGGCNRFTGSYHVEVEALRFSQMILTNMACDPVSMTYEAGPPLRLIGLRGLVICQGATIP